MPTVTVAYQDYVGGTLPRVCVVSGAPTEDIFVYRVEVPSEAAIAAGRLAAAIDVAIAAIDIRRPRRVLAGRIPLERTVMRAVVRRRRAWAAALAVGLVLLVAAAWAGAAWSPLVAIAAGTIIGLAGWRRHLARTVLPRPSVTHDETRVTLVGVHPAFAAAVDQR